MSLSVIVMGNEEELDVSLRPVSGSEASSDNHGSAETAAAMGSIAEVSCASFPLMSFASSFCESSDGIIRDDRCFSS